MWKMIRYRRGQAALIVAVAALMTACAVFGTLYDRAIQQSLASVKLNDAPVQQRGLTLEARGLDLPDEHQLASRLPADIAAYYAEPSPLRSVEVTSGQRGAELISKPDICSHLSFRSGRCPTGTGEVAVSAADADGIGWQPGDRLTVTEDLGEHPPPDVATVSLTVVGVYDVRAGHHWFGRSLTGRSGAPIDLESGTFPSDDLVVDSGIFTGGEEPEWANPRLTLSFALELDRVQVDDLLFLGARVDTMSTEVAHENALGTWGPDTTVVLRSALTAIADEVNHGRGQAQVVVPLLMAQLALLALVVLWLVLGAAVTQRRPELALAQLRGRGVRGAGWWLLRELLLLAGAGFVMGCVAAVGMSWVARHLMLPGEAPFEVPTAALLAGAAALGVLLAATGLAVLRVAREPVNALLRSVPTRTSTWTVGAADAVLLTGSVVIVIAFAAGSLTGPMAVIAPALLALSAGIGLAHLLTSAATVLGRLLLRRGRYVAGVGASMLARQPSTRQLVTIVTVASALLVFSADALITAQHNRADAAAQQNGAAVRAVVDGHDLAGVRRVLAEVDPDGDRVTPVVTVESQGSGALTEAVVPDQFRRIALFPGQASAELPWAELAAPPKPPLRITGDRLRLRLRSDVRILLRDDGVWSDLTLNVVDHDGRKVAVEVASLTNGKRTERVDVALPCREGCTISGIEVRSPVTYTTEGEITLDHVATDQGPLSLGGADDWQLSSEDDATITPQSGGADRLTFKMDIGSGSVALARHAAIPSELPALVAGTPEVEQQFDALGLDGVVRPMERRAELPRAPAGEPVTYLVNLDVLSRDGAELGNDTTIWLFFAEDDPAFVTAVDTALRDQGTFLASWTTLKEARDRLDASAAAWAVELAVPVGAASIGLAGLAMLVIAATTLRRRSFDLAALRMAGLRPASIRLVALGEQLTVTLVAVLVGATCGVVGANFAMPNIPLFAITPKVSTTDLGTAWLAVLAATLASLVVLIVASGTAVRVVGRRAALTRLREAL